jgi:uncharacterized protein (DUF488 family)
MRTLHTIGYQLATTQTLVLALKQARIQTLVDVRAVASSRRPGFAKTSLSANLEEAGIGYLHLRGLGTPAEGRVAARAGRHADLKRIYAAHIRTHEARDDLMTLAGIVESGRRVCLLCLEANPEHCHRTLVAEALATIVPVRIRHLSPAPG